MQVMTENKLVPKLRFGEFQDELKESFIKNLTKVYDGTHSTPKYVEKGIPFYSVEHISSDDFTKTKYISKEVFEKENKRVKLERGDILMTRIGSVGVAKLIDWEVNASFYVSLALFKNNPSFHSPFLAFYINSVPCQKEIWKRTIHVAFPKKINLGEISNCRVALPSFPEQQKIASFLSAVDEKLQQLTKKKELLKEYKKGVIQQIFSGELRFKDDNGNNYPDWEEKNLGKICSVIKGKQLNKSELTETGLYPALNGGINPSGYTDKWNTEKDVITISEGGNSCGYVNLSKTRFWCGGHCYSLLKLQSNINFKYLFQILKFSETHIMRLRVGSGLPNIQMKEINKFSVKIPEIDEQQKIANFLSSLDSKIELVNTQIENTKAFKKGLLQQMFV